LCHWHEETNRRKRKRGKLGIRNGEVKCYDMYHLCLGWPSLQHKNSYTPGYIGHSTHKQDLNFQGSVQCVEKQATNREAATPFPHVRILSSMAVVFQLLGFCPLLSNLLMAHWSMACPFFSWCETMFLPDFSNMLLLEKTGGKTTSWKDKTCDE
jgi:hypothetical protein